MENLLPTLKMWLSEIRNCQHCGAQIRHVLYSNNRRGWVDPHDFLNAWCTGPEREHEPFDIPPIQDPSALARWLDV